MSLGSALETWRRISTRAEASLRGVRVERVDRPVFHAELELSAAERMNGFCWLLFVMHAVLLVRDVTLDARGLPAQELSWSRWLFGLHVALVLASGAGLLLLARRKSQRARSQVAFAMMSFLLVWSGLVSGADQLIGAGITLYLIINLASALFVTFNRGPTAQAFALGFAGFAFGQFWFAARPY